VSGAFAIDNNVYGTNNLGKARHEVLPLEALAAWRSPRIRPSTSPRTEPATRVTAPLTAYGNWTTATLDVAGGWHDARRPQQVPGEPIPRPPIYLGNMYERPEHGQRPRQRQPQQLELNIAESGTTYPMPDILDELAWGTRWVRGMMPDALTHKTAPRRARIWCPTRPPAPSWPSYPGLYEADTVERKAMGPSTSAILQRRAQPGHGFAAPAAPKARPRPTSPGRNHRHHGHGLRGQALARPRKPSVARAASTPIIRTTPARAPPT